jgi:hypothetical protein
LAADLMRRLAARLGRDGSAGAFVIAIGVVLWALVGNYPRGELAEIGPGFVPWVASISLTGLGVLMVARALYLGSPAMTGAAGRALVIVPVGMAIFAFMLAPFGLFATAALSVFATSFAAQRVRLHERVILALALASLVTLLFGYALSMALPLWPAVLRP